MILKDIPVDRIDIGDRARKDYKDVHALAASIQSKGLICPIAVTVHPQIDNSYLLAAGGRRLAACRSIEWKSIPCRVYEHTLTDLELKSIELEENVQREDLEFDEQAFLMREIADIQEQIHGKKTSTALDAPGVSMRDTADMLGISHAKMSQDIKLANTMDAMPEIDWKKCKNRSEALKLVEIMKTTLVRQDLAKKAEKALGKKDNFASNLANAYIIEDFFEGVKRIPDGSIDLVEIDPPYSINLGAIKKVDKSLGLKPYQYGEGGYNEIKGPDYELFMRRTFEECFRVMSTNSWLICWFGPEPWFESIYSWIMEAGFDTRRLTAKWVKGEDIDHNGYVERTSGQTNNPTLYLAQANEEFFYARKGKPTLARPGRTNIFGHKPVPPTRKIHPTERPLELMNDILTTFAIENSRILVPYAGSGNTMLSAAFNKMIPIGFDLTKEYKEGYVIRIDEIFN